MAQEHILDLKIPRESINTFEAISGLTLDEDLQLTIRFDTEKCEYSIVEINGDIVVKNPTLTLVEGLVVEGSLDVYG